MLPLTSRGSTSSGLSSWGGSRVGSASSSESPNISNQVLENIAASKIQKLWRQHNKFLTTTAPEILGCVLLKYPDIKQTPRLLIDNIFFLREHSAHYVNHQKTVIEKKKGDQWSIRLLFPEVNERSIGCGTYIDAFPAKEFIISSSFNVVVNHKAFLKGKNILFPSFEKHTKIYDLLRHTDACISAPPVTYVFEGIPRSAYQDRYDVPINNAKLTSSQNVKSLVMLTRTLCLIKSVGYVHRDVKPENVLVSSYAPFKVALIDFGLTTAVNFHSCDASPYNYWSPFGRLLGVITPACDFAGLLITAGEVLFGATFVSKVFGNAGLLSAFDLVPENKTSIKRAVNQHPSSYKAIYDQILDLILDNIIEMHECYKRFVKLFKLTVNHGEIRPLSDIEIAFLNRHCPSIEQFEVKFLELSKKLDPSLYLSAAAAAAAAEDETFPDELPY